ncbi:MAG: SIMPL domain-containing protein, partial [Pseudomonadota bacterium]
MRYLALTTLLLGTTLSTMTMAAENDPLNYNIVNVQADATRQVSNDEMHAVLFIEKNNKQPAELSSQITQLMNQAISISKKYPQVKVETGSQTTYPVYDNDNQKLKEWRGRAEIQIESKDFKAASQLINELQTSFQTQSINFTVSDEQRKKVENELMVEASKNFQQRAQILTQAWNKSSYNLVNIN